MQTFDPTATIRPSAEANGYLKVLKEKGVFNRMVDGYLFAAAYALKRDLDIESLAMINRQDLISMNYVDEDVRLALEAGIYVICKRRYREQPADSKALLEMLSQYAEVGLVALKERWEGKVSDQIEGDIRKLIDFL